MVGEIREHQAFDVVSRATATRDIDGAFANLEAFLQARPWRDHGEVAQLRRARRMVELLVNSQVAVVNQHSPDEYSQKVQEVERLTDERRRLNDRILQMSTEWAAQVEGLQEQVRRLEGWFSASNRAGQHYKRLYERATERLKKAREDRRRLRATLIEIGELVVRRMDWGDAKKQAPKEQAREAAVPPATGGGPAANHGVGPGLSAATPEPLLRPGTNKPPRGLA